MKTIGFYRGTEHDLPDAPNITSLRGKLGLSTEDKSRLVKYIKEAPTAIRSLGTVSMDVLDASHPEIGPHEIQSDGEWVWPNDLSYYVEKYDVGLEPDFVNHALTASSVPSALDDSVIREVERVLFD